MELPGRNRYADAMSENRPLQHIPTHLLAGPLGAGKTSVLRQLMQQRPADERWAVLINEFGQVGIDAALLENHRSGVQLAEVAGGCLCCVNGVPFQVGLGRLLRRVRPQRLFIEASGLGHPATLMQQLAAPPWQGVLALQPLIMVLDAPRLLAGEPLADTQREALAGAGLLILNKAEDLDDGTVQILEKQLGTAACVRTVHGAIALAHLPGSPPPLSPPALSSIPDGPAPTTALWRSTEDWHCHIQEQDGHTSIGWRMHPDQVFAQGAVDAWLRGFPWVRAKGVLRTARGWRTFNALAGESPQWHASEWRRDNRAELIIPTPQYSRMTRCELETGLRAAVTPPPANDPRMSP